MKKLIIVFFAFVLMYSNAHAVDISSGNLLISTNNQIYEYTLQGDHVQHFSVQYPGGYPPTEYARDIAADTRGNIYVYNGTFYPYMSTYNSSSSSWSHMTYDGFSTVNNVSYGGIDVYGTTVFASDMHTYGGEAQGVVAFDTVTGQAQRFAENTSPIDLTIGLDGLLYTLSPGGSPGGRIINIYDPSSLAYIDTIDLTDIFGWTEHRSIAVDYNGDIFIADWDGEVHHINKAGELIDTITPSCDWIGRDIHCEFIDIDISENGEIALGTRFGEIILTDTDFSSIFTFDVGESEIFVEFVPTFVPEPISIDIDVKPGSYPNSINLKSQGVLPVAILGTEDFDVTTVDPASIRLLDVAPLTTIGGHMSHMRTRFLGDEAAPYEPFTGKMEALDYTDVNADGFIDLIMRFDTQEVVKAIEDALGREVEDGEVVVLTLTGNLLEEFGGTPIVGEDMAVITLKRCCRR